MPSTSAPSATGVPGENGRCGHQNNQQPCFSNQGTTLCCSVNGYCGSDETYCLVSNGCQYGCLEPCAFSSPACSASATASSTSPSRTSLTASTGRPSSTSSSTTTSPPSSSKHKSGLSGGAKAGIAIGVIAAVIFIILLIILAVRRHKKRRAEKAAAAAALHRQQQQQQQQTSHPLVGSDPKQYADPFARDKNADEITD